MNGTVETAAWLLSLGLSITVIMLAVRLSANNGFNEHLDRGRDFMKSEMHEKAIEEFNRCIIIFPHKPEGYAARGEAYFKSGQYQDSIEDCNRALSLNPEPALKETLQVKLNRSYAFLKGRTPLLKK